VAKGNDRDRDSRRRGPKDAPRKGGKKKVCVFCSEHIAWVDYKDVNLLRRFMSDRGKIRARRVSGNCSQHQSSVAIAIKTARELALLPYSQRTVSESRGGRGGPGGGRGAPRGAPANVEVDETSEAIDELEGVDVDLDALDAGAADDGEVESE
jgi:small subunit ribosomal protein S18